MGTSDVISFIGLFVAIIAIMVMPVAFYLEKAHRNLVEAQNELSVAVTKLKAKSLMFREVSESITLLAKVSGAKGEFVAAVLDEVLSESRPEDQMKRYRRGLSLLDIQAMDHINNLLMFSLDDADRRSAFYKASQSLGNLDTLRKLKSALDFYPEDAELIGHAIESIERRLRRVNGVH